MYLLLTTPCKFFLLSTGLAIHLGTDAETCIIIIYFLLLTSVIICTTYVRTYIDPSIK
jgi:hypothetical protein